MKRITLQMVKTKNPNMEKVYETIDDCTKKLRERISGDPDLRDYLYNQLVGLMTLENIDDKTRIDILKRVVDMAGLWYFTPKAWKVFKDNIKEDMNENYEVADKVEYKISI